VFCVLAPWSSATPAPMMGTEIPMKHAMSSSAVIGIPMIVRTIDDAGERVLDCEPDSR
jgi:hypothetical protein